MSKRTRNLKHENAARDSGLAGEKYGAQRGILHTKGHITDTPWGTREFGVVDPDNNRITFYEEI